MGLGISIMPVLAHETVQESGMWSYLFEILNGSHCIFSWSI